MHSRRGLKGEPKVVLHQLLRGDKARHDTQSSPFAGGLCFFDLSVVIAL